MNNKFIKATCIALSLSSAALSATLTVKFMYNIGVETGSPELMAALGLVLDLAKCSIPLFIYVLFANKKYLSALFGAILAIALSVVSFSASVAALEQGVNASKMTSDSYKRIDLQIQDYRIQVSDLRAQAEAQRKINQITKSSLTLSKVAPLLSKIDSLTKEQQSLSSTDSVTARYGMYISYVTAAALELLTWLLISVSNALYPVKHTKTQKQMIEHTDHNNNPQVIENTKGHTETHTQTARAQTQNYTPIQAFTVTHTANDDCSETQCDNCVAGCEVNETKEAKKECNSELYIRIRDVVLAKNVKPSHRGIRAVFEGVTISRKLLTLVLEDLVEFGFLRKIKGGRGYTYAEVDLTAVGQ